MDHGKTHEPYWQPLFAGYEPSRRWFAAHTPDVIFLVYQRPRDRLQPRHHPDVRDRHRRRVQTGRRRLGAAARADGGRPSRARRAHRAQRDPGRLRSDDRQQDGGRPRPHRAAQPAVRPARRLALPRHPVPGQRAAVPGPVGPALLPARPRDPQGHRELRRAAQRAGLGHRRHEPPAPGPARRPHQQGLGQPIPRSPDRRARGAGAGAARRVRARGRQRRHRAGDVADRARRDGRRVGRREAERRAPLLSRPREQHGRGPSRSGGAGDHDHQRCARRRGRVRHQAPRRDQGDRRREGDLADEPRPRARRRRWRVKYGIPHVTTDLADSLRIKEVDAVILCTPTPLHASQALACLAAGKHVQVEIPLCDVVAGRAGGRRRPRARAARSRCAATRAASTRATSGCASGS